VIPPDTSSVPENDEGEDPPGPVMVEAEVCNELELKPTPHPLEQVFSLFRLKPVIKTYGVLAS
jgi:hypothetical protein